MYASLPDQVLREEIRKLPKELANSYYAGLRPEYGDVLEKHKPDNEQLVSLSRIAAYTLLRILPLKDVYKTIQEHVLKDEEDSKRLALAVVEAIYPYWPFFKNIDDVLKNLGGTVPTEKPAMPKITEPGEAEEGIVYPTVETKEKEGPELFGGEVPLPPPPRPQQPKAGSWQPGAAQERDVPWKPEPKADSYQPEAISSRNVARPGDVARLLDANIIKKQPDNTEPKIKGNIVDLSS